MSLNKSSRNSISAGFKLVERTYPQIADDLQIDQTLLESQFSNLSAGFKVANIFLEVNQLIRWLKSQGHTFQNQTHLLNGNSSASYKLIRQLQSHPLVINSSASCKVIR